MKIKLNEFEKHFIKNAVDLYMEQINKELDEMKNQGKRPIYTAEFFPAVCKDIYRKLSIKDK